MTGQANRLLQGLIRHRVQRSTIRTAKISWAHLITELLAVIPGKRKQSGPVALPRKFVTSCVNAYLKGGTCVVHFAIDEPRWPVAARQFIRNLHQMEKSS